MKKSLIAAPFILIILFALAMYAGDQLRDPQARMEIPTIHAMFYGAANTAVIHPAVIPGMVYVQGDRVLGISSFYIGQYEVTKKEWRDIMGYDRNRVNYDYTSSLGDSLPMDAVSWFEAIEYCNKRSLAEGLEPVYYDENGFIDEYEARTAPVYYDRDKGRFVDGYVDYSGNNIMIDPKANGYRLPTSAEWEYAANGGENFSGYVYSGSDDVEAIGWYKDNSNAMTQPVGSKIPNALGIYDMSGNVSEWCWDWYAERSMPDIFSGNGRIVRGGAWDDPTQYLHLSYWSTEYPTYIMPELGFRVVRGI